MFIHLLLPLFDTLQLEANGVLDPLNDIDLFCLHHVYVPGITTHYLRSQVIVPYASIQLFDDSDIDPDTYGILMDAISEDNLTEVTVPETKLIFHFLGMQCQF